MSTRVAQFDALAYSIARKFHKFTKDQMELEDLVQAARMGLVKADRGFKPGNNVKFITYAMRCIQNEVSKFVKTHSGGLIKIPYKVNYELDNSLPNCFSVEDFWEASIMGEDVIASSDLKMVLDTARKDLTTRQREVVELVFFEQCSMDEASQKLGISKQRVSQCLIAALEKMRKVFEANNLEISDFIKH